MRSTPVSASVPTGKQSHLHDRESQLARLVSKHVVFRTLCGADEKLKYPDEKLKWLGRSVCALRTKSANRFPKSANGMGEKG